MDPVRLSRLEECGIRWGGMSEQTLARNETWDRALLAATQFIQAHGRRPTRGRDAAETRLANWIAVQIFLVKRDLLADDRARRLLAAGISPRPPGPPRPERLAGGAGSRAAAWLRWFSELEKFRRIHGHCRVPKTSRDHPGLGPWVIRQRRLKARAGLAPDRVERLERLGFEWSGEPHRASRLNRRWNRMLRSLSEYRRTQGHCNVPLAQGPHHQLALWVRHQRRLRMQGLLNPGRAARLEGLGFSWDGLAVRSREGDQRWERMFLELKSQVERRGLAAPAPTALQCWISRQRSARQSGDLPADRARRLEELGLPWNARDARWEAMFTRLAQRRSEADGSPVPLEGNQDPALNRWISEQRRKRKASRLTPEQVRRLDSLGFAWVGTPGRRPGSPSRT